MPIGRKGRRQRSSPVLRIGAGPTYLPTTQDWQRIERAYGPILANEARNELVRLVSVYFRNELEERHAPFQQDTVRWVEGVQKAAEALRRAMHLDLGRTARLLVKDCAAMRGASTITAYLPRPSLDATNWASLQGSIKELATACERAKETLSLPTINEPYEGRSWDILICELTKFSEALGLPTGAAKDSDKRKSDRPSPFVAFLTEVQRTFPEELRRHHTSAFALAQAISLARQRFQEHFPRKIKSGTAPR